MNPALGVNSVEFNKSSNGLQLVILVATATGHWHIWQLFMWSFNSFNFFLLTLLMNNY